VEITRSIKTQGFEFPPESMADFTLVSLDTQSRPNVEYKEEYQRKDSYSQVHSASAKFVPAIELCS